MSLKVRAGFAAALLLVIAVGGVAGLTLGRRHNQSAEAPRDSDHSPAAALHAPRTTDQVIEDLQSRIARLPNNAQLYSSLAGAYLQKVRESGDPAYYNRAEAVLKKAQELDPEDADTYILLGSLALSRHQFAEGLAYGERAKAINPYKSAVYGVIGDAQVELGRYDEAKATIQTMVDLRPDLSSFSRVSYIRELTGDLPGAIELMQRAVNAGAPGTEGAAWTRVQLGNLYFNSGDLSAADREYRHTLAELPGYIHARAGLAKVQAARGDYSPAIATYEEITKSIPITEYVIALADTERAAGKSEAAAQTDALVGAIDKLSRANGVNTDVEMALYSADHGIDPAGTVARAREALLSRPSIHGYDALAWALYQNGEYAEAQQMSDVALHLGSRESLLRFHAGMIALKLGQPDRAREELRQATSLNPAFSLRYAPVAARELQTLDGAAGQPRAATR